MSTLKLIAIIIVLAVGVNYAFPEKSLELRTRVVEEWEKILGSIPWLGERFGDVTDDVRERLDNLPETAEVVREKIEEAQKVFTSSPLRAPQAKEVPSGDVVLTESGVVSWTNRHRQNNQLGALAVNAKLNTAAKLKLDDLFAKQYFEHISPTGEGPADLAKKATYEYILIGENLALGNFKNDEDLVAAWMASPGHKANILHTRFTEIGVAVGMGVYEGREVWIAVQEFGLPLSACPSPDENLKSQIESNENRLRDLAAELERRKEEIDSTPKNSPEYNQKVEEYNERVAAYNALLEDTRKLIEKYNEQVKVFNVCLQG